eukprot:CAMPEP_0171183900 /NCGR_PEP_ID=MMETSP0790-20130122/15516_1 /TAXON_ID=2925 /ORGANISM="Alexandrium catenella, Strain OF101" /LENGTH=357 /DNA_ID=CAMNT_0011648889 /DNA_START=21 /DNA_END=1091 /DNA_ORIENTATION=+
MIIMRSMRSHTEFRGTAHSQSRTMFSGKATCHRRMRNSSSRLSSYATGIEQGRVPGPLGLWRDDKWHDVVPISGEDVTARLEDAIGRPLAVPASAAPAIDAAVLQLPPRRRFGCGREPRVAAHRQGESLRHHDHLDRTLPGVAHQRQGNLIIRRPANNLDDVVDCALLNALTVHCQDLVALKDPHATARLVVNNDFPIELTSVAILEDLADADATPLGEVLHLHAKWLREGDVKDGLVTADALTFLYHSILVVTRSAVATPRAAPVARNAAAAKHAPASGAANNSNELGDCARSLRPQSCGAYARACPPAQAPGGWRRNGAKEGRGGLERAEDQRCGNGRGQPMGGSCRHQPAPWRG